MFRGKDNALMPNWVFTFAFPNILPDRFTFQLDIMDEHRQLLYLVLQLSDLAVL